MPSIVMRERDLSTVPQAEVLTNAVYIPGYAIKGPVNEATLCTSLTEFRDIFGNVPYKFKNIQALTSISSLTGNFYNIDDYEKSYIIASELLSQGMPVLYERVMSTANISGWTYSYVDEGVQDFTSRYPGEYYDGISVEITVTSPATDPASGTLIVKKGNETWETQIIDTDAANNSNIIYTNAPFVQYDKSGLISINKITLETLSETDLTASATTTNDEFNIADVYAKMYTAGTVSTPATSLFDKLTDRGEYQLRFITSGAYAPLRATIGDNIANRMLEVASARGDCVALIDDLYTGKIVDPSDTDSTYYIVKTFAKARSNELLAYGATFTPYARYTATTIPSSVGTFKFDTYASFAYLYAYANSIKDNGEWNAVAGFERGTLRNCVELLQPVTNAVADAIQPRNDVAINPICYIKPRGLVIWGSRTLLDNSVKGELVAQSFLNIRQLCSSIKRQTWYTCKSLTFEQNTDILWFNFKGQITPLLDKMVSGGGIQSYSIVRIKTQKKATVVAKITIAPIEPVEDWDITLELTDGTAIITE